MNIKYRIATENDIKTLENSKVEFHYMQSINSEIAGINSRNFIWIIMDCEGEYSGFARCKKINNWWIMEGLYIDDKVNDVWAAYKLTQYAIEYLRKSGSKGIVSWTDTPASGKAGIFIKNKFSMYPLGVYRFILYENAMAKLMSLECKEKHDWELATSSDYESIMRLSLTGNSFINNVVINEQDKLTKWFVYKNGNNVLAAICWWKHDDLLDIHYTLSQNKNFDCVGGIIKIMQMVCDGSVNIVKINLELMRISSLIKILKVQPSTYCSGYMHYLLKYVAE